MKVVIEEDLSTMKEETSRDQPSEVAVDMANQEAATVESQEEAVASTSKSEVREADSADTTMTTVLLLPEESSHPSKRDLKLH